MFLFLKPLSWLPIIYLTNTFLFLILEVTIYNPPVKKIGEIVNGSSTNKI